MPNFIDAIESSKPLDDIKDVPPLPVGTYLVMVNGHAERVESGNKKTPGLQFKLKFISADEDVDRDALTAALDPVDRTLSDVEMNFTVWESPYFEQSLRQFLRDSLGIPGDMGLKQAIAEAPGQQCKVYIRHRPSQDGSRILADIGKTLKA